MTRGGSDKYSGRWTVGILIVASVIGAYVLPGVSRGAQDDSANPDATTTITTTNKKLTREERRRQKAIQKEMESPYKKWLSEEVAYIITPEERAAFKKLTTDAEREQFIEQFW